MVRLRLQVSQEKRLAGRLGAASLWLCSYEDHIQPRESLGVIKPQHPSLLCFVLVKQTQAHILFIVAAPPRLESYGLFHASLLVQVVAVKHQRLVFRIEDSA